MRLRSRLSQKASEKLNGQEANRRLRGLALFKRNFTELNLTLENGKEIAQERQKWTDIVDGAMSNN